MRKIRNQKSEIKNSSLGFSVLELIIVLAIIAIVSVVGFTNFLGSRQVKTLNAEVEAIVTQIRGAMESSRAQQDGDEWWIHFENSFISDRSFYLVCKGAYGSTPGADCVAEGGAEVTRKVISANIYLDDPAAGTSKVIVFNKATGLPRTETELIVAASPNKRTLITIYTNSRIDLADAGPASSPPSGSPPTVVTLPATGLLASSVTLNGSANPNGSATTGWFRYRDTPSTTCEDSSSWGTRVPASGIPLGSGSSSTTYNQTVSLSSLTIYYYCAIAQNTYGVGLGNVVVIPPLP